VVISFSETDAATILGREAKMEAEDLVDNFGESVNGSGAQMIRLRTTLCCKFRQILCAILQVKENL